MNEWNVKNVLKTVLGSLAILGCIFFLNNRIEVMLKDTFSEQNIKSLIVDTKKIVKYMDTVSVEGEK